MKLLAIILIILFLFLKVKNEQSEIFAIMLDKNARENVFKKKKLYPIGCSFSQALFDVDDAENSIPLLDGWGSYRMDVKARNDSSYIYFQQGLNMYYGFHIIEALASFNKATKFDSSFAMGYWGMALSYGPNITDMSYVQPYKALTAIKNAKKFYSNCPSVEKALIDALSKRYSDDTLKTRKELNEAYTNAMMKVHDNFSDNIDVSTLYAESSMILHPTGLYDKVGKPYSFTQPIVSLFERTLKIAPRHPGAAHFYIHAIESSKHPEKGLQVANRLPSLMPKLAHLVHMSSHIYVRTGDYKKGADVNEQAVSGYYDYLKKYPPVANSAPLYLLHGLHMKSSCENMNGAYHNSIKAALNCKKSFDTTLLSIPGLFGVYVQHIYMAPYITWLRFGKWDEILNQPQIANSYVYANLFGHFSQGMAYANKGDFKSSKKQLEDLERGMNNTQLKETAPGFNSGETRLGIPYKLLQAVIAEQQNSMNAAIQLYKEAVFLEDALLYNEPKDWSLPIRQYLGNALLKEKRFKEAETVYREDLHINGNNGWALTGLSIALEKQNRKGEANKVKQKAALLFSRADMKIIASVL